MRSLLALLALLALLLASAAHAQAPSPAQMGITSTTSPEVLQTLDSSKTWVPVGRVDPITHTFGSSIDPRDYGAKCDGATDDSVAIQNAINVVQAMPGGGAVVIPPSANGCLSNSTLNITASNLTLMGAQMGGAAILFNTGTANDLSVGNGRAGSVIYNINIHDLQIKEVASNKLGGYSISFVNVGSSTINNVQTWGSFNGLLADKINNLVVYNTVFNGYNGDLGHGIDFVTAGDGSVRSDVLSLTDVAVNMRGLVQGVTSECLRIDGFSNTIRMKSVGLLGCGYGLRIMNSAHSNTYYPQFGFFQDLEIEAWITAVRIEAGAEWQFSNSLVNSYHDTNPADAIVEVFPDLGASITRDILFSGSQIKTGPGTCLRINGVHQFQMTGTNVVACGLKAGPNATPPSAPVPAIDIGANTIGFIAVGDVLGYTFGQAMQSGDNYAVQVEVGATNVLLGANDYTTWGATAVLNNLAGANAVAMTSGGFGVTGAAVGGPPFGSLLAGNGVPGVSNPGVISQTFLQNTGTTSGTAAQISVATGTSNAYALIANQDGAAPTGILSTGAGDTGGLLISSAAGHASLQAQSNDVVLAPAAANNVQITGAGSFDSNKADCGNITGSTGCVVIKDNTGVVRKAPLF